MLYQVQTIYKAVFTFEYQDSVHYQHYQETYILGFFFFVPCQQQSSHFVTCCNFGCYTRYTNV